MFSLRNTLAAGSVFLLTTAHAHAVQINLSSDNIDQYFRILEIYVLPLMVVSTVVLFCGYLASRIYHRTVSRKQDGTSGRDSRHGGTDDETAAFLRELKTTPPIVEPEEPGELRLQPEAKPEPKLRAAHPLLRRRGAGKRAGTDAAEAKPLRATPDAPEARRPVAPSSSSSRDVAATAEGKRDNGTQGGSQIPRLQAAFRRPDPASESPVQPEQPTIVPEAAPQPSSDPVSSAKRPQVETAPPAPRPAPPVAEPRLRPVPKNIDEDLPKPPMAEFAGDPEPSSAEASPPEVDTNVERREPTISVVQALNTGRAAGSPVENDAVRAKAAEIVDGLDHIASVLQQSSVMLAERIKNKQGLTLDDAKALRVTGFEQPGNILEDLHRLGGDAAEEVLAAYAAVAAFNNIVGRLEQMAGSEPLDEGWNELVRSRIAETIYAVGQVRKTLGIYRRAVKKPANSEQKQGAAGKTPKGGAGGSIPVGRRQV